MDKRTIVIIEDNEGINKLLQYKFTREGYNVHAFENGKAGYEYLLNNEPPDVLILDIMLYGMSGWEILHELKNNDKLDNVPVIALTIRGSDQDIKRLYGFNIVEYVRKPFKLSTLSILVKRIIAKDLSNLTQD